MPRRRILALFTALCVAWTALWPLVSAARALAVADEMPLCHQAGMQVMPGMAPMPSSDDAPGEPKTHCPLCIMAFLAAFVPPPSAAQGSLERGPANFSTAARLAPFDVSLQLPPSRAPPFPRD